MRFSTILKFRLKKLSLPGSTIRNPVVLENFEGWIAKDEKNNNVKLNNPKTLTEDKINICFYFKPKYFQIKRSLFTGKMMYIA